MTDDNQRARYRIDYPRPARPTLRVGDASLEVVDCSESGLRFELVRGAEPPPPGTRVRGTVRFVSGDEVEIEGYVTRTGADGVAVRFTEKPIPFRTVLEEQKYLRSHFLGHRRAGR